MAVTNYFLFSEYREVICNGYHLLCRFEYRVKVIYTDSMSSISSFRTRTATRSWRTRKRACMSSPGVTVARLAAAAATCAATIRQFAN